MPARTRVEDLAKNMREKEVDEAQKMVDASRGSLYEADVVSATHDVLPPHHDRDFRAICLFLLGELLDLKIQSIRIVEVSEDSTSTIVHNFAISEVYGESNPLFFVAHRGHMRWLQPSILTGIHLWKEWRVSFDCIHDITVMNWGRFSSIIIPPTIAPLPCRRCGQSVKVPIPSEAFCGWPIPPRKRLNPVYNQIAFESIPLTDSTGVVEGREAAWIALIPHRQGKKWCTSHPRA